MNTKRNNFRLIIFSCILFVLLITSNVGGYISSIWLETTPISGSEIQVRISYWCGWQGCQPGDTLGNCAIYRDGKYMSDRCHLDDQNLSPNTTYCYSAKVGKETLNQCATTFAYVINSYNIGGGSVSPPGSSFWVYPGSDLTFSIAQYIKYSNYRYRLQSVLVDGVSVGAVRSYTFTNISANHTIQSEFKIAVDIVPTVLLLLLFD
jgi:hypothetical protein